MPAAQDNRGAGLAANVAAVLVFSWGFIFVKLLELPAPVVAFWRLLIGAGGLTLVAVAWRMRWPGSRGPVLLAGVAFGVHQLFYITATQRTSVAIVTLVGSTAPLAVSIVSHRIVGERAPRSLLVWSTLAVAGVSLVVHASADDASRTVAGDLLAVANVFAWLIYFLAAKKARLGGAPTLTFTAGFLWVALAVVAPVAAFSDFQVPDTREMGLLLALALGSGNGHLLVNWAHDKISAAMSSLIIAAVPLIASVWAHLVVSEPYTWRHAAGMLLVVVGIEGGRRAQVRAAAMSAGEQPAPPPSAPLD